MSNQTALAALALRIGYDALKQSHSELDRTKKTKGSADDLIALVEDKIARVERGRFNVRWVLDKLELKNVNDTWVSTAALTGPQQRGIDHYWVGTSLYILDPLIGDYVNVGDLQFRASNVFVDLLLDDDQFFDPPVTRYVAGALFVDANEAFPSSVTTT